MLHFGSFRYDPVLLNETASIGLTARPSYPRQIVRTRNGIGLLEGMIYNKTAEELRALVERSASDTKDFAELIGQLEQFVSQSDGEFLLIFYDQARKWLVVANDSRGRLPVFYSRTAELFLLSREPKFVSAFLPSVKLHRTALLAYLLFGFTFGKDTLIEGVAQLQPGTILAFDCKTGVLTEKISTPYPLEAIPRSTDRSEIVRGMTSTFMQAVSCRIQSFKDREVVVSLSGGLDSRAVLAGVLRHRPGVRAVTLEGPEVPYAQRVAKALGVKLDTISMDKRGGDIPTVDSVFLKDGLDAMPCPQELYLFLEQLVAAYHEEVVYMTGAYGGEVTRFLHLTSGIRSTESLADYLLTAGEEYKYSTDRAVRILGTQVREVHDSLLSYLNGFPEKSPCGKYLRFRHEFDRKYTGNAEDRNRFYVWTTTPFAAPEFVRFALSIEENRKNTRLFRDFLRSIDPRTCQAPYYNLGVNLDRDLSLTALAIVERLARFAIFKKALVHANGLANILRRHEYQAQSLQAKIIDLIRAQPDAGDCFDVHETLKIIRVEQNAKGLSRLHTLLSYLGCLNRFRTEFSNPAQAV